MELNTPSRRRGRRQLRNSWQSNHPPEQCIRIWHQTCLSPLSSASVQSPSSRRTQGTRRCQRARSLQPIFFLTLSACLPSAYSLSELRTSKPNARHWQCILAPPPPQGPKRGSPPSSSTLGTSGADEAEEEEFVSPWRHRQPPRPHTAYVYGNTKPQSFSEDPIPPSS